MHLDTLINVSLIRVQCTCCSYRIFTAASCNFKLTSRKPSRLLASMADDSSTDGEGPVVELAPVAPLAEAPAVASPDPDSCDHCYEDPVSISMEWYELQHTTVLHHSELCFACAACTLLKMPHDANLQLHPMALRLSSCPVLQATETSGDPEDWRPLKKRRRSELFEDHMCAFCQKWQVCASMDMLCTESGTPIAGEFCFRCCAKYLLDVNAGKCQFVAHNSRALLQIV